MRKPPFDIRMDLEGWTLFWAEIEGTGESLEWLIARAPVVDVRQTAST